LPKFDLTDGLQQMFPIYLNVFIFIQYLNEAFSFVKI